MVVRWASCSAPPAAPFSCLSFLLSRLTLLRRICILVFHLIRSCGSAVVYFFCFKVAALGGCGSWWWSAAVLLFCLAFSLFWLVVADSSMVGCNWSVFGFFFTLDSLGALVCFRSVEICTVHGCLVVTTPECLEATFVVFFSVLCCVCIVVSLLIIDWWDWIWFFAVVS